MNRAENAMILMVEDDAGHALLIEKNLRRAGIDNDIIHIDNDIEAADYLFGKGIFHGKPTLRPMLILLDLNLPGLDGFQILEMIRADKRTANIPVIILTTTDNPREVEKSYALGCNVYVTKPVEYEAFSASVRSLGLLLSAVRIPPPEKRI